MCTVPKIESERYPLDRRPEDAQTLLGRLLVGKVVPRKVAIEKLGEIVRDAPLVALASRGLKLKSSKSMFKNSLRRFVSLLPVIAFR